MRAAKLMRAAHGRLLTRLSRAANHPPETTPSHFPAGPCARRRRQTVGRFHKGVQGLGLMRAAKLMRANRTRSAGSSLGTHYPRLCLVLMHDARSKLNARPPDARRPLQTWPAAFLTTKLPQ